MPPASALTNVAGMGNSLLDFVMALARDPQAAARYAADPAGALAAAGLPGVTVSDVANLMPVVTDSLAMATPDFGTVVDTANVWASGAAAAAFDAFDLPHHVGVDQPAARAAIVADPSAGAPDLPQPEAAPEPADPIVDLTSAEPPAHDWFPGDDVPLQDFADPHAGPQGDHPAEHPGFDLF